MPTYRIAQPRDMDELIDFINMVFSMVRVPHDFVSMLPKVYAPEHSKPEIHFIAEENGHIVGCLGMLVFPLNVCEHSLRVGYLGSVAVHPRFRGHGIMRELMERQIAAAKAAGLDMLVLGGQRQRYQYYGFETCGTSYRYHLSAACLRHALADDDGDAFSFKPMDDSDVTFAYSLYNAQPVCGARTPENFLACLRSYHENPQIIMKDAAPVGYFVLSGDGSTITEIVSADDAFILPAIKKWMSLHDMRRLNVEIAPHSAQMNGLLASVCEGCSIGANAMFRMLRPQTVLPAYMALKNTYAPLADGTFTATLSDLGAYAVTVDGGHISVVPATGSALTLNACEMHQLFFGCNPFAVSQTVRQQPPSGWFPLPCYIPEPDSF